jgi:hypothetical protein
MNINNVYVESKSEAPQTGCKDVTFPVIIHNITALPTLYRELLDSDHDSSGLLAYVSTAPCSLTSVIKR